MASLFFQYLTIYNFEPKLSENYQSLVPTDVSIELVRIPELDNVTLIVIDRNQIFCKEFFSVI